jgi:hypothetical protein
MGVDMGDRSGYGSAGSLASVAGAFPEPETRAASAFAW